MTQQQKAETFRALHVPGNPLVLFNIWDAGSARAVTAAGAKAIATGSWSVAAANGMADGEALSLDFALANLQRIVAATDLPVTIDLERGYGDSAEAVANTVTRAINAGAIGANLEDSRGDGGLRDIAEHAQRLAAVREAARARGIAFFINARTDVWFQKDLEEATRIDMTIERAQAYAKAGADGLFVPGIASGDAIRRVVHASPIPVNVMVMDNTPSLTELAALGVARVSHGPRPFIALMQQLEAWTRDAMRA